MKSKLIGIINEFGKQLTTSEYNQYVTKLRNYLIPYILEKKGEDFSINRIFNDEFTRSDIVNATIYYVKENQNVESLSAIDDYLIAINRLFDELLFDRYPNPTLMKFKPFTTLSSEVQERLLNEGVSLKGREVNPTIDEDQYKFIIQYLKKDEGASIKSTQVKIIIKLYLLYGFSHDILSEFKIEDYNPNQKTLEVEYVRVMKRKIYLELPYLLALEIDQYLKLRQEIGKCNSNLLFTTRNNVKITHSFLKEILEVIKQDYINNSEIILEKNQFTPTGLQKYAIIQMILSGMNQSVIMDFTGQQQDIYNDCQNEVNKMKELNRNRYINHMIRGIVTYDLI